MLARAARPDLPIGRQEDGVGLARGDRGHRSFFEGALDESRLEDMIPRTLPQMAAAREPGPAPAPRVAPSILVQC